jgi:glutaredoxin
MGVKIVVHTTRSKSQVEKIRELLSDLNPEFVESGSSTDFLALPSIEIIHGDKKIVYTGIPEGIERRLFFKAIEHLKGEKIEKDIAENAERIKRIGEVETKIFVAPFCPHCGKVVRKLIQISSVNPKVRLNIIDATQFPEISRKYEIISVPVILIDGKRITGEVDLNEILDWLEKHEDPEFVKDHIKKLIAEGRAGEIITTISKGYEDILVELIEKGDFFTKLGAMYLIETMYERDKKSVEKIKNKLIELLSHPDYRIREDSALLIGKIGEIEDLYTLKRLKEDNEEVKESIEEAIQEINERLNSEG